MMARHTHTTKRAILSFLEKSGEASPTQIAEALGAEWASDCKQVLLRQMLGRMTHAKLLIRARHGVYRASPNHRMIGIDRRARTEDSIREFLEGVGGRARTVEIHRAVFGYRDLSEVGRTAEHVHLHEVLRASGAFRRSSPGVWEIVPGSQSATAKGIVVDTHVDQKSIRL